MPKLVDLGSFYGVVEFPDGHTAEQIVAAYDGLEEQRKRAANRSRMQTVRQVDINAAREESRIPERIALGVDAGLAAAPIAAGNVLRALVPTRSDIESSGQRAPSGFTDDEVKPGFGGFPVGMGVNAPSLRALGRQLVHYGVGRQKAARDEAEQLGGGISGAVAGSLAETAVVSAQTLPFAALGLGPAAVAAGLQQYGLTKEQFKQQLQQRNPELSDDEAYRVADGPAAITGAATGALVRSFGGTERFINRIVSGQLKVGGVKQLLREANLAGGRELPEEYLDQLAQGFTEKAFINPEKPVSDIFNEAAVGGLTGYFLGAGTTSAIQAPLAVAGRVEEAAQESRLRRDSREQSRERIRRVIAEREANAESATTATVPPPISQAPPQTEVVVPTVAPLPESDTGQTGIALPAAAVSVATPTAEAAFAGYQFGMADQPTYQIPGARPGILRNVSAEAARVAGYTVPDVIPTFAEWQAATQAVPDPAAVVATSSPAAPLSIERQVLVESVPVNDVGGRALDIGQFATLDESGRLIVDSARLETAVRSGLGSNPGSEAGTALLLHLLQTRAEHPLNPIQLVDAPSRELGFQGRFTTRYGSNVGTIELALRTAAGQPISDSVFVKVLNHELVHNAVTSKFAQAAPEIREDAKRLYDFILEQSAGTEWQGKNATANIDEFFSEALSSRKFRNWLASVDYSQRTRISETGKPTPVIAPPGIRKSAFGKLLEIVKRLLALPDFIRDAFGNQVEAITALDQAIDLAARLERVQRTPGQQLVSLAVNPEEPPPIEGLQVAGAAAQVGRIAEEIYRAREAGGQALEGLAYERKQFKTARAELKRLAEIAYGRFGASAQTEEPIVFPDPTEGVGITDGNIVVDDTFVNTLNAVDVPHSFTSVQAMQGEIFFEGAAKRLINLQAQVETLTTARQYYTDLGVAQSEITKIDEKIAALQTQEGTLGAAEHNGATVSSRASEIRATEELRPQRLAQRASLSLEPVSEFFGRQVGGYRDFVERAGVAQRLAEALRDAATDPAEIARLTAEAERWMRLPDDIRAAIKSGLPLTNEQRASAFATLAQVFDDFDLTRARMNEIVAFRLPEIDKEERAILDKIAGFKITSGMAEVMISDVLASLDGESGGTGTLQSQAVTQELRQRFSAIQSFAFAIGENLETNRGMFEWLANPTTPPVVPVGASFGVDQQTLAMILDEVKRNPAFAIVTLVAASQKKLANMPVVQLEQIQAFVAAGDMQAALALARSLQSRAEARASIANSGLRESIRALDGLNIERMALENGVAMFDELAAAPDFTDVRNAVANSPFGLVEPMVAQNNTATTFKPFGADGIPSHPGFAMGASDNPVLKSEWFHRADQWYLAAQHHLDAYDAAEALHNADPLANPQPSALGFDLAQVRGLRDATQRFVPGSFLEISLLSENKRWKIPRLVREMSKTAWFRQHDVVAKMVGGIAGTDLRGRLGDFVNHFLIARSVIQQFSDIPGLLHAAMRSHPAVQMNMANYREIWNELAHWGRLFGSPVRIGFVLPRSGAVVTAEDLSLLKRQRRFEEELRRRVTETNPTAGIRIQSGGRELVRAGAYVGDEGLPRHLNRQADSFIADVVAAYGTDPVIDFDAAADLSAGSVHPVAAFWNSHIPLLVQHVLDVRRGDRAMRLDPTMQAVELATEGQWRSLGVPPIHSLEDLVNALVTSAPPMHGWNVRDRVIEGLNAELRQYRDAANRTATERAEREQARNSGAVIAFSAENEFTRPAAKLELPSAFYDYGALTPGEHLTITSRANHERVVAYATAVQRAISELQNRLARFRNGTLTEAQAASSYGGNLDEMKQVMGLLEKIAADFEAAYRTGNPAMTQSQWYREGFGLLTSAVLALPTVGLRNMTQGQFETYVMSRAMGLAGHRLTMWRALKTAVKTVARFATDLGLGVLRRTDIGASFLTGKNVQLFSRLADQISSLILTPDYLAGAARVHELGYDTRDGFIERLKRIWEQTSETATREELGGITIPVSGQQRRVAGIAGVPVKALRAALDQIGVQQYDQAINASLLTHATWLVRRMEEVAITYGMERARQGLTAFDGTDPRWQLQPDEFGAFKSEQQNKDALGLFRLFLELSANSEGFQLERNMWEFYQAHQAGQHPALFNARQFDAVQRRLLAEFNASTPANRASAAAGNNVVRNLLTLQGYVSDGLLKLINLVAGGSRDRTVLAATLGKLPTVAALALMAVLIGYMAGGLTGEWEKRIRGRAPTLPTPFDRDFWTSWKRWYEGTLRLGAAQLFYIGDIILAMRGEVQGNRGFDPVGRVFPISIVQRALASMRGMWNTVRGSGSATDALVPLADFGRSMTPYWLEVQNAFGASQGAIKQGERIIRGEAHGQGLISDSRMASGGPTYGPNTIVRRNVGEAVSAYWKAQQAGDAAGAEAALVAARAELKKLEDFYVQKYVKAGDAESVAITKAKRDVWGDYQEINPVVSAMQGKRPTAAQYELIRGGMSGERTGVVDTAVQAWQAGAAALFGRPGSITREDVAAASGGGGGRIPSRAVGLGGGSLSAAGGGLGSLRVSSGISGYTPVASTGIRRRRRGIGGGRTTRRRSIGTRATRRRLGPRITAGRTTRRRLGNRRRRSYTLA